MRRPRKPGTPQLTSARYPSGRLARVVLAVYLAACLIASGALTSSLWTRGDHPTPEHWSYHLLLEHLGIKHHHGPVAGVPASETDRPDEPEPQALLVAAAATPFVVAASAASGFPGDGRLYQLTEAVAGLALLGVAIRRVLLGRTIPLGLAPIPPEKPPPTGR